MKDRLKTLRAALLIAVLAGLSACNAAPDSDADEHEHAAGESQEATGPNGGRLFTTGDIVLELGIAEAGTPPRWQAWITRDGKPLAAKDVVASITTTRLGGRTQTQRLQARADGRWISEGVVAEPHSFQVRIDATVGGAPLRWNFEQVEGRTTIPADMARESGIVSAVVGAGEIADEHEVQGLLAPLDGRVARVAARFPGPVRSLHANIGDRVRAGQVLARVESNLSLSTYALTAPISGVVLRRDAAVGDVAGEGAVLFEIANLDTLWVDLHVFGADATHIRVGSPVLVSRLSDGANAQTTVERVLPGTATASQSTVARAILRNDDGLWRPGTAVRARITVDRAQAALVVPNSALQTLGEEPVVFVRVGDQYEARPVEVGKRDAERAEIVSGLVAGDQVVVEQSYVVKADIEKSGVAHDH